MTYEVPETVSTFIAYLIFMSGVLRDMMTSQNFDEIKLLCNALLL